MKCEIWKLETNSPFICDAGDVNGSPRVDARSDRRSELQRRYVYELQHRKDDFVQSKDDIYILRIEFLEDVQSKDDIYISRIEVLEDAESEDDFER